MTFKNQTNQPNMIFEQCPYLGKPWKSWKKQMQLRTLHAWFRAKIFLKRMEHCRIPKVSLSNQKRIPKVFLQKWELEFETQNLGTVHIHTHFEKHTHKLKLIKIQLTFQAYLCYSGECLGDWCPFENCHICFGQVLSDRFLSFPAHRAIWLVLNSVSGHLCIFSACLLTMPSP